MSSPSRPRILLLGKLDHAPAQKDWESLSSLAELVTPCATHREAFIEECRSGALDGVVAVFRTFTSVGVTGRFDEELVRELPRGLKWVSHNGAGYDQIDIPACTSHGIHVSNVPDPVNDATADTTMFLILGALRNYNPGIQSLRQNAWRGSPPQPLGHDPQGKVLGILGMGGIGRNLKTKAEAFGMTVVYHNRNELSKERSGGARYVGLEPLLRESDVVSLNLPLNPQTHHIISHAQLALMKPGVVIVNTARGAVIDEAALVAALDSGKVFAAGLDVYEEEPKGHGLRR
ncbi:hypothetical protein MMC20_004437 [Loxospora ochrophaea]|nr:hypothetical protein [Loxospora ochrophaea]